MADTDSYTIKPQRLGPQVPPNHSNPSKFYTHFLYKAVFFTIFLVLVPLFPSQPPEFINQTLHTRSWELLQLLFVGIAVSYGLFSKRNDETEKEHSSKFDNAQSYVSRLLQVSSVFDDEIENPSGFDENKVQTWNSQYYRGEPMVVVAEESSALEEQRVTSSQIVENPLNLPIRSLKTHVSDSDGIESTNVSSGKLGSVCRSRSKKGSKRFSSNSNKSRNGEFGRESPLDLVDKVEKNVVLPSPIPWRSRSGRMEMKEDGDGPPLYSLPPSMEDNEFDGLESRSFRSQSSRSSRNNSNSSSPNNLSPLPSISSELQSKNVEDMVRKKSIHKSSPPPIPPPPPPPPPFLGKSPLMKSNSNVTYNDFLAEKELKRSIKSVPKELSESETEDLLNRANSGAEWRARTRSDNSLVVKSVRTIRPSEPAMGAMKARELGEDVMNGKAEKRSKEGEATFIEKRGYTDKFPVVSKQTLSEFRKEDEKEFGKMAVETDEDSESEDDGEFEGNLVHQEAATNNVSDGGPDVDKKADEFIAKFREQIRLQRIASIRRSTGQTSRNSLR